MTDLDKYWIEVEEEAIKAVREQIVSTREYLRKAEVGDLLMHEGVEQTAGSILMKAAYEIDPHRAVLDNMK